MKILLMNTPVQPFHTTKFLHSDWPDITLAQLAAVIDDLHEVVILDNWAKNKYFTSHQIINYIHKIKPQIIGISNASHSDTKYVIELTNKIKLKYPKIIIIGGGQAATVKYKYLLKNKFDIIVLGEGENTLPNLINAIEFKQKLNSIKGIAFINDNKIIKTKSNALVNLNKIPHPIRKYQTKKYSNLFPNRLTAAIETSRGCPYKCKFCSITSFYNATYRKKENKKILKELKEITKAGPTFVFFIDDSFGIHSEKDIELCKQILKNKIDIKWYTQIRPDTVVKNPNLIKVAATAGLSVVSIGFESFNNKILKNLGKKNSKFMNKNASKILKKNNILIHGKMIVGAPKQKKKDVYKDYNYLRKYSDFIGICFLELLPGTILYKNRSKSSKKLFKTYKIIKMRYYLGIKSFIELIFSKNQIFKKFKIQEYKVVYYSILFKILQKIKFQK